jgi:hypothetical protein
MGEKLIFIALGMALLLLAGVHLAQHEYSYFDSLRRVWFPTFGPLLAGLGFLVFGVLGVIREMRWRNRSS